MYLLQLSGIKKSSGGNSTPRTTSTGQSINMVNLKSTNSSGTVNSIKDQNSAKCRSDSTLLSSNTNLYAIQDQQNPK